MGQVLANWLDLYVYGLETTDIFYSALVSQWELKSFRHSTRVMSGQDKKKKG